MDQISFQHSEIYHTEALESIEGTPADMRFVFIEYFSGNQGI
jgi:hypothetical protein